MALIETLAKISRKVLNGDVIDRLLDLETLLSMVPTFEVTILHDAIYAIYHLARDVAGTNKMKVDYSKKPRELFRDVTEYIVRSLDHWISYAGRGLPKPGSPLGFRP